MHVVVDDVNSYIFSKAFRGIEDVLRPRGFGLTISSHDNDPDRQESIVRGLVNNGVRGIILYPALAFGNDNRPYHALEALLENVSVVCMDRFIYNSRLSMPYVTSDNFYASYPLTRLLLESGHTRIGFVRNYNVSTVVERLMGFKQALHDYGVPCRDEYGVLLQVKNEDLPGSPPEWLGPRIATLGLTAVFTTSYNLAGHVMNGLSRLGLSIPGDISLVSYEVEYEQLHADQDHRCHAAVLRDGKGSCQDHSGSHGQHPQDRYDRLCLPLPDKPWAVSLPDRIDLGVGPRRS
jgi:DNA-binding LacI/PurR family transcriptional regulator